MYHLSLFTQFVQKLKVKISKLKSGFQTQDGTDPAGSVDEPEVEPIISSEYLSADIADDMIPHAERGRINYMHDLNIHQECVIKESRICRILHDYAFFSNRREN